MTSMDESPLINKSKYKTIHSKLDSVMSSKRLMGAEDALTSIPMRRSKNTKSKSKFYVESNKVINPSTSDMSNISEEGGIVNNCRSSIDTCMIQTSCILF